MAPDPVRLEAAPFVTVISPIARPVTASEKTIVTVNGSFVGCVASEVIVAVTETGGGRGITCGAGTSDSTVPPAVQTPEDAHDRPDTRLKVTGPAPSGVRTTT